MVVSGGNVAGETASGILKPVLARPIYEVRHPSRVRPRNVTCSCGNTFQTRSTRPAELHEICSVPSLLYGQAEARGHGRPRQRFQRRLEKAARGAATSSKGRRERAHRRPGCARGRDDARPVGVVGRRPQARRRDRRGQPADLLLPAQAPLGAHPGRRGRLRARRVARHRLSRPRHLGQLRGAGGG